MDDDSGPAPAGSGSTTPLDAIAASGGMLVIGTLGAATELGRSFLIPAAPNIAHFAFFVAALYSVAVRE